MIAMSSSSQQPSSRAVIFGTFALVFSVTTLLLNHSPLRGHTADTSVSAPATRTIPIVQNRVASHAVLPTQRILVGPRPIDAVMEAPVMEAPALVAPIGWAAGAVLLACAAAMWSLFRPKGPEISPIAVFAATSVPAGFSLAIAESDLAKQSAGQANVTVDGTELLLIKEGAKVYAVQARCAHLPLKLKGSKVQNGVITCSKHNSTFSCATGKCQDWLPGEGMNNVLRLASSQPKNLMAYATKVIGGKVYVNVKQQVAMMATSGEKDWSFVVTEAELERQPNRQLRSTVNGVDLLLVKDGSRLYAMQARCAHLPLKLQGSKVENGVITCSKHGSKFNCATGAAVEWLPGGGLNDMLRMASPNASGLKVYPTKVADGKVFVSVA